MVDRLHIVKGLVYYELTRELRKKSFYLLIVLAVLPVIVAIVLRLAGFTAPTGHPRAWASILGFEQAGSIGMVSMAGLAGWAWLVSILYGGDLVAADARDGLFGLLFARPVRRVDYLAAKMVSVVIVVTLLFTIAGTTAVASAWILVGPQEAIWEALGLSALLGLSCLPLLLASALLGAYTRSPVQGMIFGFAVYMVSTIIPAITATLIVGPEKLSTLTGQIELAKLVAQLYAYIPFVASFEVPGLVYGLVHGDMLATMIPLDLRPSQLLPAYSLSTITGIVMLVILLWYVITYRDY